MRLTLFLLLWLVALAVPAQTDIDVVEADIVSLQEALENGSISSVQLVDRYLARIAAFDKQGPALNSIIRLNPAARERAAELDAERGRGETRGPLHGIPIVVKDNYNTVYMPTTGGSVALADFVPTANAHQVDLLEAAGAIVLAKTNLHEYAYGITTIGSLLGQTRNPYDIRRVPGGSSGGTAAAVAASFAAIGLGSDTCGSIRIPAAFNNLIGLRPSKGLSSIYGVMPLSHTQDVAGPLARSAEDLAIVLDIVSGQDPRDPATELLARHPQPEFQASLGSVAPADLRLGRLSAFMERADNATREVIDSALAWFQAQGTEVVEVEIPEAGELISRSGLIGHEFRTDLNQYLALFGSGEVQSLSEVVDQGLYHEAVAGVLMRSRASVPNEETYAAARAARTELRTAIEAVLAQQDLDAIVYPPIAEQPVMIGNAQPGNNCSLSANSGLPALSIPVGFSEAGLPVGMELLGGLLSDAHLLAIGHAWEQAKHPRRTPPVTPPLENGQVPAAETFTRRFAAEGVRFTGEFTVDPLRNRLQWQLTVPEDSAPLHAVALIVATGENFERNEPVHLTLLGPQASRSEGDHFMSPAFRQALEEQRVYLRVFAPVLDPLGVSQPLRNAGR